MARSASPLVLLPPVEVEALKQVPDGFWDEQREKIHTLVLPLVFRGASAGAERAVAGLVDIGIGVDMGLVNGGVQKWAGAHSAELVSQVSETTRRMVRSAVSDWVGSGQPITELRATLAPTFGKVRAEMIAVTEVTGAFAEGNVIAWRESGVVDGLRWMTAEDERVCPLCSPLDGQEVPMDGTFDGGVKRPPRHVRCRCWLQPVLQVPKVLAAHIRPARLAAAARRGEVVIRAG